MGSWLAWCSVGITEQIEGVEVLYTSSMSGPSQYNYNTMSVSIKHAWGDLGSTLGLSHFNVELFS